MYPKLMKTADSEGKWGPEQLIVFSGFKKKVNTLLIYPIITCLCKYKA